MNVLLKNENSSRGDGDEGLTGEEEAGGGEAGERESGGGAGGEESLADGTSRSTRGP